MAIDNVDMQSTPSSDDSSSSQALTASIPVSALPAGTDVGDTLQIKVTDLSGQNARVQVVRSTAPSSSNASAPASKPGFSSNMPVNQMRDWLTQEATIHAADQTNV